MLDKSIVLVGIMGAGKSSVGRRLADALGADFVDVDSEIEAVSDQSIPELFEAYGEVEFRALETRVLARLLDEKPRVIATGGGAFTVEENHALVGEKAISIWLDADLDTLFERVRHKDTRPLLRTADPKGTLGDLLEKRRPFYERASLRVPSLPDQSHEDMVRRIFVALGLDENAVGAMNENR